MPGSGVADGGADRSPGGTQPFVVRSEEGASGTWAIRVDGGEMLRITRFASDTIGPPAVSPAGKVIAFGPLGEAGDGLSREA